MKTLLALFLGFALFCILSTSCKKDVTNPSAIYDTADRFTPEEMKWINYKLKDKIYFISNKMWDTINFVVADYQLYEVYRSYHFGVTGSVYFKNLDNSLRVTSITIGTEKNSSSYKILGKLTNVIGFELYNSKAATGLFPSVSASSRPYAFSEDKRDKDAFLLPTFTNFSINSRNYQNVYKLTLQYNPNIGATFLYVNRDNGILRIDFADGEVWERVAP
jgi:hypothetical protein